MIDKKRSIVRLVGHALLASTLTAGCGSGSPSSAGGQATAEGGPSGSPDSLDSGSPSEGGESIASPSASDGQGSVDSSANDSGSSESASTDSAAWDSGRFDATNAGVDSGGDAPADAGIDSGGNTSANVPPSYFMRYEAESPLNMLTFPVEGIVTEGDAPCPGTPGTSSDGVKEGAKCASAGHVVNQLLGRSPCTPPTSTSSYTNCGNKGGGVTFNDVAAPADGVYDVTFWYHSGGGGPGGSADTYGDVKCGGLNYNTGPGSGCRPHLIYVNGVQMASTVAGQNAAYYEFPAYPGSWTIVHGAVVALPLRAGSNTIYIKAPGFTTSDAADLDALDVQPSGQGAPAFQATCHAGPPALPIGLITPVVNWN
jgi:hypothetical protein